MQSFASEKLCFTSVTKNIMRYIYVSKEMVHQGLYWFFNLSLLAAGVNLINVLRAAFACADPESIKKLTT